MMPDSVAFQMVDRVAHAYLNFGVPLLLILLVCVLGLVLTKRSTH